jgi:hypothetical protein
LFPGDGSLYELCAKVVTTGREFLPAAAMPSFISTSTVLDGKRQKRRKNRGHGRILINI